MPNLKELYLCGQQIEDLTPLKRLPLRQLYLCDNRITDLTPLADIYTLQLLYIAGELECQEAVVGYAPQITSLAILSGLEELDILKGLTNLRELDLVGIRNASLEPLLELELLERMSVNVCSGLDYSVLAHMPALKEVHAWDKQGLAEIEATCPERDFELLAMGSARE